VGKVTEQKLHSLGILTVGDIAKLDNTALEERLGKWGLALAGKARGEDAGAWFEGEIGDHDEAKSISHEHTYDEDTANVEQIEATLMRLSEMVGRRLRENQYHARTLQLKLRYKDFTTITRAHTLETPTQLDNEIFRQIQRLFHASWRKGAQVRLLGVQASHFSEQPVQGNLLEPHSRQKWEHALSAMDRLRDKFGESSITLGTGMKGGFRERTHDNPAALPGKARSEPKPPS
jgi:DNA polymerase-4